MAILFPPGSSVICWRRQAFPTDRIVSPNRNSPPPHRSWETSGAKFSSRRGVAVPVLRHDLCHGRDRRHHAADHVGPVDHRVAAGDRHTAAALDRGLGRGVREVSADPAIPPPQSRHEPRRIPDDLLVGVRTPPVGPADRFRLCGAVSVLLVARAVAEAAARAPRRHPAARLRTGRARLVHGRERPRRAGRGQPVPAGGPSRAGAGDLCGDAVDRARAAAKPLSRTAGEGGRGKAEAG